MNEPGDALALLNRIQMLSMHHRSSILYCFHSRNIVFIILFTRLKTSSPFGHFFWSLIIFNVKIKESKYVCFQMSIMLRISVQYFSNEPLSKEIGL